MKKLNLHLFALPALFFISGIQAYRIDNKSDQTIHVYVFKEPADAGAVLLAKGWSTKSLNLMSSTASVAEKFDKKAMFINWGIQLMSHLSTDAVSEIIAQILSVHTHLYVAPHSTAQWSVNKIMPKLKNHKQKKLFFLIFPTTTYGAVNYDTVIFMGSLNLDGHYAYTQDGKMYDVFTKKIIDFKPFTHNKEGNITPSEGGDIKK